MSTSKGMTGEGRMRGDSQRDGSDGSGKGVINPTVHGDSGQTNSGDWLARSTYETFTIGRKFSSGMMSLGSFDGLSDLA